MVGNLQHHLTKRKKRVQVHRLPPFAMIISRDRQIKKKYKLLLVRTGCVYLSLYFVLGIYIFIHASTILVLCFENKASMCLNPRLHALWGCYYLDFVYTLLRSRQQKGPLPCVATSYTYHRTSCNSPDAWLAPIEASVQSPQQ